MSSYNVKLRRVPAADYDTQIKEVRNQLAEQLRVFDSHLEQKSQVLQDLSDYLRRRGEIEGEYARSLDKLADRFFSKIKKKECSTQSVLHCWQVLLNQTREESRDHTTLSDSCGTTLPQQLSRSLEHVQRLAKKSKEICTQLQEELLKGTAEMQNTMKIYSQYHTEFLSAENKLKEAAKQEEKQKQSAAKKIERLIEKRQCKVQEIQLKCTKARNDYLLNLEAANASMNQYYLHDLSAVFDCSDLGFHQSLSQVLQIYLSRRQHAHQNLGSWLHQLDGAQAGLDQNQDRDALMQAHEITFCLPFRFQYQPHEKDQVCEVSADCETKGELETRFHQLQSRLSSKDNQEFSQILEVSHSALADCINEDIFRSTADLTTSQSLENISDISSCKMSQAKRRANLQETENSYFTKVKEHLINGSLMSKLQAKHDLIKVAILKAETVDSHHHRKRSRRSLRQRKNQSTSQSSLKPFSGDMLSYIQASGHPIPLVVESCVTYINLNGLHHEGIFRVPGSQLEVNRLRDAFESGDDPLADEVCDMDTVACVLKLYFRGMENPLFPKDSFEQLMECGRIEDDEEKAAQLKTVILSYPPPLIVVMRYLFAFLHHVSQYSDENMMQPYNLAVCFGPSLIRGPEDADAVALQQINVLVKTIIIHHESIFPNQTELEGPAYETCMTLEQEDIEPAAEEGEMESDASPNKEVKEELEGVALFDYTARSSVELSFKQGGHLILHNKASSDWWRGEINGTKGLIPDKYISVPSVQRAQDHKDAERNSSGGCQKEEQPAGSSHMRSKVFSEKQGVGAKITLQIPTGQLWTATSPGALRKSVDPQKRRSATEGEIEKETKIQVDKDVCRHMDSVFKELAARQDHSSTTEASSFSVSPPQNPQRKGIAVQKGRSVFKSSQQTD
ncbi:rho GTPase-activating protein 4a [Astyanax mexicanus]|uniref:rho GTPase-activating protein 4a n=1 Tax=Astyanax mexicanus TaxID=7994 RepID=UPI0020CB5A48|nr:rho GTPase-activating protein 4a [Astyanax mexicanus]XP_049342415.1 rho GTPase-activating protein 4a [Astyanax mexicanus]XP_049342416.1 rho GTPase-activating protein 4a [Astyanax mexicanus]XP_049342417.1 rho GTPase-activating protein 4a [Astyanax mexicanus]